MASDAYMNEKNNSSGNQIGGASYEVGDIIEQNGKQYRVVGGDPSDPDVEEI
jgi:hypothetical protein